MPGKKTRMAPGYQLRCRKRIASATRSACTLGCRIACAAWATSSGSVRARAGSTGAGGGRGLPSFGDCAVVSGGPSSVISSGP